MAAMASTLPLFLFSFLASLFGVRAAIGFLRRRQILDNPNERSSHDTPTPRGAGLALIPVLVLGLIFVLLTQPVAWPSRLVWMGALLGLVLVSAVSWFDDFHANGVRRRIRFGIQIIAVVLPVLLWPIEWGRIFPDSVSPLVERAIIIVAWLWFTNLYNFMDGINGISGVETLCIALGLILLYAATNGDVMSGVPQTATLLLGAALGFLWWNARPQAMIFLGDSGSIGLGYLVGWVLIVLASTGHWAAALILPMVYLFDATLTIAKRAFRGKKIWDAHREHFYQKATSANGRHHLRIVVLIAATNIVLIGSAIAVAKGMVSETVAFGVSIPVVCALLVYFTVLSRRA
jgi:UDP-N-acetylmuramyl pentapeptide phosphotransferase/UDP-N-acetylglucosamine-1-phosphate transferase